MFAKCNTARPHSHQTPTTTFNCLSADNAFPKTKTISQTPSYSSLLFAVFTQPPPPTFRPVTTTLFYICYTFANSIPRGTFQKIRVHISNNANTHLGETNVLLYMYVAILQYIYVLNAIRPPFSIVCETCNAHYAFVWEKRQKCTQAWQTLFLCQTHVNNCMWK